MKTTPWFPGDVKPVRSGVYEREDGDGMGESFSWFEVGQGWSAISWTVDEADRDKHRRSIFQDMPWRGLTEQ